MVTYLQKAQKLSSEGYIIISYHDELSRNFTQRNIGDICCLSSNFLAEAMKRIGKEKLIKLIESGI